TLSSPRGERRSSFIPGLGSRLGVTGEPCPSTVLVLGSLQPPIVVMAIEKHEMNETIFNLFVYINNGIITEIGATRHQHGGTDEEKISHLQMMVPTDYKTAIRMPVRSNCLLSLNEANERTLNYETFMMMMMTDQYLEVFEPVL